MCVWHTNVWLYACLAYSVPSSWGMFVYRELISRVAIMEPSGICVALMNCTKSLVSLM